MASTLIKARAAADAANQALAEAQALADAADQRAADQRAADQRAAEDAAAAWAEERRQEWPTVHRGERRAAWNEFVDAIRTGGDALAAWVAYRRTCVALVAEAETIERAYDTVQARDFERARVAEGAMNEAYQLASTMPLEARQSGRYAELLAQWHEAAEVAFGPDHGDPRPVILDRPDEFAFKYGRLATDESEPFAVALDRAMRIIESEQVAATQAEIQALIERR